MNALSRTSHPNMGTPSVIAKAIRRALPLMLSLILLIRFMDITFITAHTFARWCEGPTQELCIFPLTTDSMIVKGKDPQRISRERLRQCPRFAGCSDEQADQVIDSLERLSVILFEHYHNQLKHQYETSGNSSVRQG